MNKESYLSTNNVVKLSTSFRITQISSGLTTKQRNQTKLVIIRRESEKEEKKKEDAFCVYLM